HPPEGTLGNLFFNPSKMAFTPPLVAEREHHLGLAADLGDGASIGDRVGDRLVEEHVLAGLGRGARGLEVRGVGGGVDDGLERAIGGPGLVRGIRAAAVLGGELVALIRRAAVAAGNGELAGALDRVGEHVRPPAHANTSDLHLIAAAASCATRSSNSQFPPATPTPPMHSPSARIGAPPSIAVQRSGPAARAGPGAWARASPWPPAPLDPVARLLDAAPPALVVAECTVWNLPPSMRSRTSRCPPASTTATVTAIPASFARASAVSSALRAPAVVRRFPSATYMVIY